MAVRRRQISCRDTNPTVRGYWGLSNPYPNNAPDQTYDYASYFETLDESEGHPWHLLGKTDRDIGGDFKVTKQFYSESNSSRITDFSMTSNPHQPGRHHRTGQWAQTEGIDQSDFPLAPSSSKVTLAGLGATAIARVIPTNPLAGLAVALGELRSEGIPTLVGLQTMRDRTLRARNAGDEYLNVQFGWLPLVGDIESMSDSFLNSDELTREYEQNSGKRLKRRFEFPPEISMTETDLGLAYAKPALTPTGFYVGDGRGAKIRQSYRKVRRWFSGCFTYYLPPYEANGDNRKRNAQLRNYLYGTRLTPETAWNLAPWTWAVDWVTNFGDVIHNVTAFANDGLVMPYAYMMEESIATDTYVLSGVDYVTYPEKRTYTQTFTTVVKQRIRATPFGFGLDSGAFTGRQWAILGALGLSRGDNHL